MENLAAAAAAASYILHIFGFPFNAETELCWIF
jgi:hypothetical protein